MRKHSVLNLFWQWSRIIDRACWLKKDAKRRDKIYRFGVGALIYSALTIPCVLSLLLLQFFGTEIIISIFCLILAGVIGIMGTVIFLITALIYWFCQLSVNRKAFTWISLFGMLFFLCIAVISLILIVK